MSDPLAHAYAAVAYAWALRDWTARRYGTPEWERLYGLFDRLTGWCHADSWFTDPPVTVADAEAAERLLQQLEGGGG